MKANLVILGNRATCGYCKAFAKAGKLEALRKALPSFDVIDADKTDSPADYKKYRPATGFSWPFARVYGTDGKPATGFSLRNMSVEAVVKRVAAACAGCSDAPAEPARKTCPTCKGAGTVLASLLFALVAGCRATDAGTVVSIPPPVPALRSAAVIAGLVKVDPGAYGGWDGACPGCDLDAARTRDLCVSCGIVPVAFLRDAEATRFRFVAACAAASAALKPAAEGALKAGTDGPLLLVYYSGHGGQAADFNGDEADGKDETVCLYDGELTDDLLWEALCKVPAGVRVAFITDSCNSGTNYRAPKDWARVMRVRANRVPGVLKARLVHIGGCADGESSYGGEDGGEATNALLASFRPGVTWRDWFKAASKRMPRNQKLTWAEEPVGGSFGDTEALK